MNASPANGARVFLGVHPRAELHPGNVHSRPPPNFADSYRYQWRCSVACSGAKGRLAHCAHLSKVGASFFVRHVIVWHTAISAIPGGCWMILGIPGLWIAPQRVTGVRYDNLNHLNLGISAEAAEANLKEKICKSEQRPLHHLLLKWLLRFRSWFMALVIAEMKVEKITMADMITTTLKRRSISLRGVTWNEDSLLVNFVNRGKGKVESKGLSTHRAKIAMILVQTVFLKATLEHCPSEPSRRCCLFNTVCFHLKCQQRLKDLSHKRTDIRNFPTWNVNTFIPIPWK